MNTTRKQTYPHSFRKIVGSRFKRQIYVNLKAKNKVLTMLQAEINEKIACEWFESFNNKDLEKLLALYDEDAKHYSPKLKLRSPETHGVIQGKNALRVWWKDAFERLPNLTYLPTSLTANEKRVFMEYLRKADGEPDMMVAEVLEIEMNKIVASRVYHG